MKRSEYLLGIDQGTTGTTVLIIDVSTPHDQNIIAKKTIDYQQHYPKPGWVEHDLNQIWQSVQQATGAALAQAKTVDHNFSDNQIIAIGITNQRETICVFDRQTSEPLCKAIVWQCRRSAEICTKLKEKNLETLFIEKTGLVLDPYFSGTKITWLTENNDLVRKKLSDGSAILGTIDTYLLHRLTSGTTFATEASNASRTLLFNIERGVFDPELCDLLKVPRQDILPEVKDSYGIFGKTKGLKFLADGIPISGVLGDQQAALAGQTCFAVGEAKCTYGTGAFLLVNLGNKKLKSSSKLLTTVAWSIKGQLTYAFEGSAFIAGAAVQFIRDQFGWIKSSPESESLATKNYAAPLQYFVPALTGLGAPYWDPHARGAFLGLTRGSSTAELTRATLEGISFQVCDLLTSMSKDLSEPLKILRVDGGATSNDLLMQIQADLAGIDVDRPKILETTAFGAGLFAGLGIGLYKNLNELKNVRKTDKIFKPNRSKEFMTKKQMMLKGWNQAIKAVRVFAEQH